MRYTRFLLAFIVASCPLSSLAAQLTIERIFAAPDLSGPRLREPKFSPDGRYVTYLQAGSDDKDRFDLWAFDTRTRSAKLLVDSRVLVTGEERLSAEEQARRERQRTASLRGIVEYQFAADGQRLLIPLGGDLYLYDLSARSNPVRRLTQTDAFETDSRFSPRGNYVSFVRDQDLFIIELASGRERALTTDGEGLVQNGVAEFIAQEEMGRRTGYWWSPDERRIAYTRIDDAPVDEVERLEVDAGGARVVRQRYPAAGTANTKVELRVLDLASEKVTTADTQLGDGYLARVTWLPDSGSLAVQRETRDQKRLDLLRIDATNGTARVLLTETSAHWIELHDDLKFLKTRPQFVWASRRSGYRHLYLYDLDGKLIRPLTAGEWMVVGDGTEDGVVGIDEAGGRVYFTANERSPLERHLYVASLDTRTPQTPRRISQEDGWHDAELLPHGQAYLDVWSSPQQPPTASLRTLDGKVERWLVRNALDETHPYHPFQANHVAEEFGTVSASDGQALHYRLLKPAGLQPGRRYPVVVDTYGGPHAQTVRKDWMGGAQGYFRQVLAQHGFVVFMLDNRGSGFRGNEFEAPIAGQLGKVEIEDQVRGVEFLKTLPYVDVQRVGIMGWSYGGYMTSMALTTTKTFAAGVAGAPVIDWRLYDTHYTERYLGTPQANAAGYERSSPLPYVGNLSGHLLLVHGMADDNVLFTNSTMLMQALQAKGKQFELMTYPGSKHGLVRAPQTGRHYYEMVLEFFERELRKQGTE